jgi:hypothetical protein
MRHIPITLPSGYHVDVGDPDWLMSFVSLADIGLLEIIF